MFVPSKPHERCVRNGTLVYDCRMLLVSQVENPHTAICGDSGKDPQATPSDVVNLLVMGNKLCVYLTPLNVPAGFNDVGLVTWGHEVVDKWIYSHCASRVD